MIGTVNLQEPVTAGLSFRIENSVWELFKQLCQSGMAYPVKPLTHLRNLIVMEVMSGKQIDLLADGPVLANKSLLLDSHQVLKQARSRVMLQPSVKDAFEAKYPNESNAVQTVISAWIKKGSK